MTIEEYVTAMGNCLLKESVDALDQFINEHPKEFGRDFVRQWNRSGNTVKEITLYKLIYNRRDMPIALRKKAETWLKSHKCKTSIF